MVRRQVRALGAGLTAQSGGEAPGEVVALEHDHDVPRRAGAAREAALRLERDDALALPALALGRREATVAHAEPGAHRAAPAVPAVAQRAARAVVGDPDRDR